LKTQCKYCNRVIKGKQPLKDDNICFSCYEKLPVVRRFIRLTEPLRKLSEEKFIQGTEFALDNGLPVPPADIKRYTYLIEKRSEQNAR
jgi:hypothetical protein